MYIVKCDFCKIEGAAKDLYEAQRKIEFRTYQKLGGTIDDTHFCGRCWQEFTTIQENLIKQALGKVKK